jgi:hypothetical protein
MILVLSLTAMTAWGGGGSDKAIVRSHRGGPAERPHLGKGDLYALVVGVSKYRNPGVPQLKLSAGDAKAFAEFLGTQEKVFRKIHLKLLVDDAATKKNVEKYLGYEVLKAGRDDTVVLFFSGHGSGDPKKPGEYFFLTTDADPKYLEATAVKMSGLEFLKGLDAERVVVIADACHAGAFSRIKTKSLKKSLASLMQEFGESSGRVILTSSKPNEYSQEKPGLKQSVFTYYLLKGLKGEADSDRDGVVTLKEAYDYTYERTKTETEGAQHPQLEGTVVGSFPLAVLTDLGDPLRMEVSIVAQDPRCANRNCTDPPDDATECTDPLCGDVTITDGSVMYSGQNYQIAFRPSSTSYVYVYQIDSGGDIYKLFPGEDYLASDNRISNPLKGGRIYWVPAKDKWLRQDDRVGREKIYVVAGRSRNRVLEDLYGHLQEARRRGGDDQSVKSFRDDLENYLETTMGPTKAIIRKARHGTQSPDPKIRSFESLSELIESAGLDAVKSVWFWHRRKGIGSEPDNDR